MTSDYHKKLIKFRNNRRISIKRGTKSTPFKGESVNAGREFSVTLCSALQEAGIPLIPEYEDSQKSCKIKTKTKKGHSFRVDVDAIIPSNNGINIALEIKYMEAGIFFIPDTKKIAYDFLHLRESHPDLMYIVISGGRLSKTHNSETKIKTMLTAFSDKFFDLDIEKPNLEERFDELVNFLKRAHKGKIKPSKRGRLPSSVLKTKYYGSLGEGVSASSFSESIKEGISFEEKVKKKLSKNMIPYVPKEGCIYIPCSVETDEGNELINIEGDIYIPSHKGPVTILECKNMKKLTRPFLSGICIDSWLLKNRFPKTKYYAVLGPSVSSFPRGLVDGYIDGIIFSNGIDSFLSEFSPKF